MEPERFKLLGPIRNIKTIARGRGVRNRRSLQEKYGGRNWRKRKGNALIEDEHGWIGEAEIHWFEAHGVGRVDWKIKTRFYRR
jgi:hypothetical protein